MGARCEGCPQLGKRLAVTCALPQLLDAHRKALDSCRRCAHDDPAVLPVLSAARIPRVMLVGQAPGKTELILRMPFAGRSGKTLFRWLQRAGLDEPTAREHVYIAAVTRCYPGPSPNGRGDRVPSPRERELCAEWLDAELRIIRPALIIPVGRLAIDRFIGSEPLDRVIGKSHVVSHTGGDSEVIPLPHPSGASAWVNLAPNRAHLDRALRLLQRRFRDLGVTASGARDRRSA